MNDNRGELLKVQNLSRYFHVGRGGFLGLGAQPVLRAVDNVSFSIYRGETLGLVGESGCGKSTLGQTILQLYRPTRGDVFFAGENLCKLNPGNLRKFRMRMQIVFQDPYSSLDPRMTIGQAVAEPLIIQKLASGREIGERVDELLATVGLNPGLRNRYPHEFSGGQRQRIAIARAIAAHPEFLVADEPISAMDVSIQAQIINLLEELQESLQLTYLFISHDLRVVRHISDRVAVMYLGKIVEIATRDELYNHPLHPYTNALLASAPALKPGSQRSAKRAALEGDVPSPINMPRGCAFASRCPRRLEICTQIDPVLRDYGAGHMAACHAVERDMGIINPSSLEKSVSEK